MPYIMPLYIQGSSYTLPAARDGAVYNQYLYPQAMSETPLLDQYIYPGNLPEALQLIREAVAGEAEDRMFYQYLIDKAPADDKETITGIRNDEIGHAGLFRYVYMQLTGEAVPPAQGETFVPPASYCEGLRRAITGETNAVRKYRRILFALQDRVLINILTAIITDEIRHGTLYATLYAKNGCSV
jgi:rubrerythrin